MKCQKIAKRAVAKKRVVVHAPTQSATLMRCNLTGVPAAQALPHEFDRCMNKQGKHPTTSQRTLEWLENGITLVMLSSIISITTFVGLDVTFALNPDNHCSTLGCQHDIPKVRPS